MELMVKVTFTKSEGRKQDPYDVALALEEELEGSVTEFSVEDDEGRESFYEVSDITVVKPELST